MAVARAGVDVGGTGVAVGGAGVAVGGTGVAVGGADVAVGGTGVDVGGTGVATATGCAGGTTHDAANSPVTTTATMVKTQSHRRIMLII